MTEVFIRDFSHIIFEDETVSIIHLASVSLCPKWSSDLSYKLHGSGWLTATLDILSWQLLSC